MDDSTYSIIITRVDLVDPIAKRIIDELNGRMERADVFDFAIGLITEYDNVISSMIRYFPEDFELISMFTSRILEQLRYALPNELMVDECFSLKITEYNNEADIFTYTREIPRDYAENKIGLDFEYLQKYFNRS